MKIELLKLLEKDKWSVFGHTATSDIEKNTFTNGRQMTEMFEGPW